VYLIPVPCLLTCIRFYVSFIWLHVYAFAIYPMVPGPFAGVPSSQALQGFLITTPPPVFVPAVLGALAVWIPYPKKNCLYFVQTPWDFFQTGSGAFRAARSARAFDATTHREKVPRHCVQAKWSLISICWKSRVFLDYSIATDKISRIELAESSLRIWA